MSLILKQEPANTISTPPAGKSTMFISDTSVLSIKTPAGAVTQFPTVQGSNTQLFFNDDGAINGSANLTFTKIFEAEMDWLVRNKVTTKEEQLKNINDFISESLIGKKDLKEKKGIDRLSGKEKDINPNAPLRAFAVKDEDGNYTPVTYKKIEDVYKDLENTFAARKYFMQSVMGCLAC
jgi:hypothetical protein